MPPGYSNPYSSNHEVREDGSVTFNCTRDSSVQPWLALQPHHPVVVQTQAFWTSIGSSLALAGMEATQWSALTWIDWELGDASGGHAVHGIYRRDETVDHLSYAIELFNETGGTIVHLRGRGVVFRKRNFEKWRETSKEKARAAPAPSDFTFANRTQLGLEEEERALVAPFDPGNGFIEALVTPGNGFPPGNPLIGGSGDHVNSTHLGEIARQALFLVKGRTDIDASGEMSLNRYVELGTPLRLNIAEETDNAIAFSLEQLGRPCAEIMLRW